MRILKCSYFIFLLGLLPLVTYSQPSLHTVKFDKQFKSSASRWLPGVHFYWLKAQCFQESRFNQFAVSPVGASGFCQFMPSTAKDVAAALDNVADPFNVRWSIEAAAYYDARLYRFWRSKRPELDRIKLMLASYNAGAGNLHKSQKLCAMATLYDEIIVCLPAVTKVHSRETINYVRAIEKFRRQLIL